ncbi:hypothetical protein PMAYCL1PPCAC_19906, partial [Pristionchus mayeri]
PPKKIRKIDEGGVKRAPDGIIRFEIDKISTLYEHRKRAPNIEVRGLEWKALVDLDDEVEVMIHCTNEQTTPFSISMNTEFILVHPDNNNNNIIVEDSHIITDFDNGNSGWKLVDWKDLVDCKKGFIKNDTITIEIRFRIFEMRGIKFLPRFNFTDADDPLHDITFIIEGEKVYANKAILAAHSPYFKAMFYRNFAEKNKD